MSCFYFCFFLLIFVFKVLGSLYGILLAHGQARHGLILHLIQMRKPQCTVVHEDFRIKRNAESALWDRPHSFALFPYLHPGNKVKPGNVTEKCHTDEVKR